MYVLLTLILVNKHFRKCYSENSTLNNKQYDFNKEINSINKMILLGDSNKSLLFRTKYNLTY